MNPTYFIAILSAFLLTAPAQAVIPPAAELLTFVHNDHLGTPVAMTDDQATVVWRATKKPFGETTVDEDPDGDGLDLTLHIRFPGQYYDGETEMHYNWQRYYDAGIGRYLRSDPIGLDGGLNTFLYTNDNPERFIDPTGENIVLGGAGAIIGAVIADLIIREVCDDTDENCMEHFKRCIITSLADEPGSVFGQSRCGFCKEVCVRDGGWPSRAPTTTGTVRCDYWNFSIAK